MSEGSLEGDVVQELPKPSFKSPTKKKSGNSNHGNSSFQMSGVFDFNEGAGGGADMASHFRSLIQDDNRFLGKTIVITGAGGQIGREGCLYFAKRGAFIAALDLSKDALKETFKVIKDEVRNASTTGSSNNASSSSIVSSSASNKATFDFRPYVCDVTNAEQIDHVVESIVHRCGRIDYLWNNAGYQGKIKPLVQQSIDDYKMCMDINVTGMFIVLQAVAKRMIVQDHSNVCSIVNTSSVAGQRGTPCMQGYAASKAAIYALSVNAAKELAQYGIRVNTVSPALIGPGFLWERQNKMHAKVGPPFFDKDPEVVAASKIAQVPLKRLGTPEEVVKTVAFLFSNDASYITGININVDGGMAAMVKG